MEMLDPYNLIIAASLILILSFFFNEVARKTSIPSVLLLIVLGIGLQAVLPMVGLGSYNFFPVLEILGIVGLIMIVLEAALELELKREKLAVIVTAFVVGLIGLVATAWAIALILNYFIPDMGLARSWLYATPLAVISSAIVIPSVTTLGQFKKEFHIYESTFSDILGIMMFYFLAEQWDEGSSHVGPGGYALGVLLTIVISVVVSYLIVIIFQKIRSHTKLFLLIAVLLLFYSIGKKEHLSSLIMILIFGLIIANMQLCFQGPLRKYLVMERAKSIYEGLKIITFETAFVVRTFFFVIFGLTIALSSLLDLNIALISVLIVVAIYLIRFVLLRIFVGSDLMPQLMIVPRGLITILLFYSIPENAQIESFSPGILLYVIIITSVIMTGAMIFDKRRSMKALKRADADPIGYKQWKAPTLDE